MPLVTLEIRGKKSTWGVRAEMSNDQIEAMREDGVEVGILENVVPAWIVDAGLIVPFCFFQDLWNFKNPFRR